MQNSLNGSDNSLIGGLVAAATLVVANILFDGMTGLPFFSRLIAEHSTLLLKDRRLLAEHLERENVSKEEIEMAAREHGIDGPSRVRAATSGSTVRSASSPRKGARCTASSASGNFVRGRSAAY